jgi:hypothetical protein
VSDSLYRWFDSNLTQQFLIYCIGWWRIYLVYLLPNIFFLYYLAFQAYILGKPNSLKNIWEQVTPVYLMYSLCIHLFILCILYVYTPVYLMYSPCIHLFILCILYVYTCLSYVFSMHTPVYLMYSLCIHLFILCILYVYTCLSYVFSMYTQVYT